MDTRDLTTERPTKKFDHKWIGHFKVTEAWTHRMNWNFLMNCPRYTGASILRYYAPRLLTLSQGSIIPQDCHRREPQDTRAIDAILASKRVGCRFNRDTVEGRREVVGTATHGTDRYHLEAGVP